MNNQYNQYYYFNPSNKFSFETFINEKKTKIKENNFVYGISNQIDNKLKLNNEKKIYPEPGKILIMDLQKKIKENENKEAQLFTFENNKNQNNEIEKDNQEKEITKEEINNNFAKFKENLNKEYQFDTLDIDNLNGKELNDYLKKHKNIDKITIKQLKTILPKEDFEEYMKNFEGIENPKQKHLIREYVDQILDNKLDEKFSNFIIKLRDLYYKKKTNAPLKAKKRFVVGMREIEKYLKLKELLCLFIVPNIEKVKDEKNSLDLRILDIINKCRTNEIPILFGLNKYKLGKISRKKISCVSMLGIVDVKGLEKELKDIVEYGEHFRRDWYIQNYNNKDKFKDNPYILMDTFEYYQNQLKNSKEEKI
jgi:selenocysteine insertion sequence-binding protein 2